MNVVQKGLPTRTIVTAILEAVIIVFRVRREASDHIRNILRKRYKKMQRYQWKTALRRKRVAYQ
jgi:hypothetical protein